ncbi:Ferric reductase OS=Stutzerimonas stutzeri OX=316 GN=CXK95_14470 PE=4 SV=1 [Stutzerimonas stutzeri]
MPKWLVGAGWLEKPVRHAGPPPEGIFGLFRRFRGLAEDVGKWAFYAAAILIVLALIKTFPYRWFFKTHRWLAVAYLALVAHSVVLTPPDYWSSPLGLVLALMMGAGSVAACISLLRRIGRKHKVVGRIDELIHHPDNRVLRVGLQLEGAWPTEAGSSPSSPSTRKKARTRSASPRPGATTASWRFPSRG